MPIHAVADPTIRKILEGAAVEEDPDLKAMWENLLVKEAVEGRQPPRYLDLLGALEPAEARFLNAAVAAPPNANYGRIDVSLPLTSAQADNLQGLSLIRLTVIGGGSATENPIPDPDDPIDTDAFTVTSLARNLIRACGDPPEAASSGPGRNNDP